MESISVKKSEVIKFRVAEILRKVNKFIKSFSYRMEVIKWWKSFIIYRGTVLAQGLQDALTVKQKGINLRRKSTQTKIFPRGKKS